MSSKIQIRYVLGTHIVFSVIVLHLNEVEPVESLWLDANVSLTSTQVSLVRDTFNVQDLISSELEFRSQKKINCPAASEPLGAVNVYQMQSFAMQ